MTSSNRPTYCKAGAGPITRCNADTCGDIDRAGWPSLNKETAMPKQQPAVGPDDEDKRLLVIDLAGGISHGVQTNIPELQGVKVLVLGDKKDSQGDRDEVVIEGTDWIVYQTERVAISDCTWRLKSVMDPVFGTSC